MMKKTIGLAVLAAVAISTSANAASFLSGTFTIDIYNYNSSGVQANSDATLANLGSVAGTKDATVTYTGALDFRIPSGNSGTTTIADWFDSGTGTVTGLTSAVGDLTLSTPTFQNTTMFDIVGIFAPDAAFTASIQHDDGVTVLDDGLEVAASAAPTQEKTTGFSFNGGELRLIYVAANGNPSVLEVTGDDLPTTVPLPAGLPLLLAGLGGFAVLRRRKAAA